MNYLISLIFFFIIIIFNSSTINAQKCEKRTDDKSIVGKVSSFDSNNYKHWEKIDLNELSFYAPKELKLVKEPGRAIDSKFYRFESENYTLTIDISPFASFPNSIKISYSDYCESFFWIDGAFAWYWTVKYDEEAEKKYNRKYDSGIFFQFEEDKNYRIGMYLFSKSIDIKETSEKLFKSVQFKKVSQDSNSNGEKSDNRL